MKQTQLAGALMALAAMCSAPVASASVTVGTYRGISTCIPFGCASHAVTTYQQVYSAAAFSGIQAFNTVRFSEPSQWDGNFDTATYTISFSTTSKTVSGLDTSNPSNNVGADNVVLGTFTLSGAAPTVLSFSGAEFDYDPALGNLLMNVTLSNVKSDSAGFYDYPYYFADSTTNGISALYGDSGNYFHSAYALVTTFDLVTPTNVPEPMTPAIFGLGLVGIAAARRNRKH